jgi:hypothetical protein
MHPDYCQGFWEAQALDPLYDGASREYEAGWRGYWECRRLLDEPTGIVGDVVRWAGVR